MPDRKAFWKSRTDNVGRKVVETTNPGTGIGTSMHETLEQYLQNFSPNAGSEFVEWRETPVDIEDHNDHEELVYRCSVKTYVREHDQAVAHRINCYQPGCSAELHLEDRYLIDYLRGRKDVPNVEAKRMKFEAKFATWIGDWDVNKEGWYCEPITLPDGSPGRQWWCAKHKPDDGFPY